MLSIRYIELGIYGREYNIQRWDLMTGNTINREGNWWQAILNTEFGNDGRRYDIKRVKMAGDAIYRDGIWWLTLRYTEMGMVLDDTIYWVVRCELMEGDRINIDGSLWEEMRNTEMGTKGIRYDRQRWKLMEGNTINRVGIFRKLNRWEALRYTGIGIFGMQFYTQDENCGKWYDIQRFEHVVADTIYRDGKWWQAMRYTDKGFDDSRWDIQRWELMAGHTI